MCIAVGKKQRKGKDSLHYLAFQVLPTPYADSTVVPSTKVNGRPWVTANFAPGISVSKQELV